MSADARLSVSNFAMYRESVVPAFLHLCDGAMEDWLRALLVSHEEEDNFRPTYSLQLDLFRSISRRANEQIDGYETSSLVD